MNAVYVRVSTNSQDTRSQDNDLKKWAGTQDGPVTWYRDKATGLKMARPGFDKLLRDIRAGKVKKVVVWRLDRLGRTARGLLQFFEDELQPRRVGFVSLKDSIDLSTAAGRMMVGVLASVAQFEAEVRSERQRAGIEAAKEAHGGKVPWGGRVKGSRSKRVAEKEQAVKDMAEAEKPVSDIARVTGLTRQTIYRILGKWDRKNDQESTPAHSGK